MTITIKKKFKSLIRPLSTDEYEQLEQNLLDEGCRDPLVVWGDILLDGHNRHAICTKHDIPFNTVPAPSISAPMKMQRIGLTRTNWVAGTCQRRSSR